VIVADGGLVRDLRHGRGPRRHRKATNSRRGGAALSERSLAAPLATGAKCLPSPVDALCLLAPGDVVDTEDGAAWCPSARVLRVQRTRDQHEAQEDHWSRPRCAGDCGSVHGLPRGSTSAVCQLEARIAEQLFPWGLVSRRGIRSRRPDSPSWGCRSRS
jgi:hypothetical protein